MLMVGSISVISSTRVSAHIVLYVTGDKDTEYPVSRYEGNTIEPGEQLQLNATGRSDAASGTEGWFNLVDPKANDKVIRHFYWDCPWGSKSNTWNVTENNSKFMVEYSGQNLNSGALGTITVRILNVPN